MEGKPILAGVAPRDDDVPLYFYEIHESDSEVFADLLLAHETEYDEAEFLELVLEARERVKASYTQDSLIEAVAADLARREGFIVVDDSRLRAAVNVSAEEGGTFVADVEELATVGRTADDFRTLLVDVDPEDSLWGDVRR